MCKSEGAGRLSPNEFSLISEKQKRSPLCETPFGIFYRDSKITKRKYYPGMRDMYFSISLI